MDNKVKAVCNYRRRAVAIVMKITDDAVFCGEMEEHIADYINSTFAIDYFLYLESVNH